jgi:hypothetical protein
LRTKIIKPTTSYTIPYTRKSHKNSSHWIENAGLDGFKDYGEDFEEAVERPS